MAEVLMMPSFFSNQNREKHALNTSFRLFQDVSDRWGHIMFDERNEKAIAMAMP